MTSARNRLHSICPYFAMFPEQFVRKHVVGHTDPGDVVFDPFSGRGTTVLESLLLGRDAYGTDLNPVAVCVSNAKAAAPLLDAVLRRLRVLEAAADGAGRDCPETDDEFFTLCFHRATLAQVLWLRAALRWRTDPVDCFIAAVALGCLHGESHKTGNCFSNRMPRTISTKKAYSIAWWRGRGSEPPRRDVFAILRTMAAYRLATELPVRRGRVAECDARAAASEFAGIAGKVRLVVTSPPYLDMTDYREDQWLRLWFLGGDAQPTRGHADDRHRSAEPYWQFLVEVWRGIRPLLAPNAMLVVRIGGTRVDFETARARLLASLREAIGPDVAPIDAGYASSIRGRQTNNFRPGTGGVREEFDFRYQIPAVHSSTRQ